MLFSSRLHALHPYLFVVLLCATWLPNEANAQVDERLNNNSSQVDSSGYLAMPMPIGGVVSVFGDELTQWDVLDYNEERIGELRLRFPPVAGRGGDITQWTFRLGDYSGTIRPKFAGRADLWDVRIGNDVATVRTTFPNQFDQWSIENGKTRIVYAVRDFNLLEYWSVRSPNNIGLVEMYTRFEGDPRDWEFYDELKAPVTPAAQLAMLWLPVYFRLLNL